MSRWRGAELVRRLERAGHLHPEAEGFAPRERARPADSHLQGVVFVILHQDVRPPGRGGADLEDVDDVRVPGPAVHRALFAKEPFEVLRVRIGGEDLDRDGAIEGHLPAAVDDAEAAAADLLRPLEPGGGQLRRGCSASDHVVSQMDRIRLSTALNRAHGD